MFDPLDLIDALARARVDYIVIGGFAVGAHGFPRATNDLDIVPDPSPGNLERLAVALRDLQAVNHGAGEFDPAEFPFDPLNASELAEGGNFLLMTRAGRLDVMQWVPGIPGDFAYPHLRAGAISTTLSSHRIDVCSREDLITMKRTAGRDQDLIDLRSLGVTDLDAP
jgi:hypothetical protein